MALKDLVIPTVDVVISGGNSFPVRGLSSIDIEWLLRKHGDDFKTIWDEFLENDVKLTELRLEQIGPMIKQVISRIPNAMRDLIGVAADADEDDLVVLGKLPIGVQVSAVSQIVAITLNVDGDWSKTMETVMKMLGGANGALAELLKTQVPSIVSPSPVG